MQIYWQGKPLIINGNLLQKDLKKTLFKFYSGLVYESNRTHLMYPRQTEWPVPPRNFQ
jgi:hypothetical protein